MSLPEVLLWQRLRRRPAGYKFRRQHPAGRYVLDFFCVEAKLAVEVDGRSHEATGRPERDAARDAWMAEYGVRTLRIAAVQVLHDVDAVVARVVAEAASRG